MHDSIEQIVLSREELYELVWATPMRRLVAEFAISDVGLAKICKRHKIPRPTRGYWAKLQYGKSVHKHPLSSISDKSLQEIRLQKYVGTPTSLDADAPVAADTKIVALINAESDPSKKIPIATSLQAADPYIMATNVALLQGRADEFGRVYPSNKIDQPIFGVRVSSQSLRRALLLLHSIVRALHKRGYSFGPGEDRKEPEVDILGIRFQFGLWEPVNQKKADKYYVAGVTYNRFGYEYSPSGRLELSIRAREANFYMRLRDTKINRLEDRLNYMLVQILKGVDQHFVATEIAKQKAEIQADRKTTAIDAEVERRKDGVRETNLLRTARKWRHAVRAREFVEAVRSEAIHRNGAINEESEIGLWLGWADDYLEKIDPLSEQHILPQFSLTEGELSELRKKCAADWCDYREDFSLRKSC
ncbi:hypothetical protein [Blastopirellula marina]|uniref:Uncharacterized protein n=1 Tax=Blastopirellula marina DSM 3645 TaxID=314230 RepID=A3ZSE9_9BACT|nr:hypothetical protein [Blastopirellula marina]EAQ80609.1 hypothetical protein DSM3645_14725 [Blastopirellula marina DSM 3645]